MRKGPPATTSVGSFHCGIQSVVILKRHALCSRQGLLHTGRPTPSIVQPGADLITPLTPTGGKRSRSVKQTGTGIAIIMTLRFAAAAPIPASAGLSLKARRTPQNRITRQRFPAADVTTARRACIQGWQAFEQRGKHTPPVPGAPNARPLSRRRTHDRRLSGISGGQVTQLFRAQLGEGNCFPLPTGRSHPTANSNGSVIALRTKAGSFFM
jgi:hypothetical protein